MGNADIHRAINRLASISILMAQYDAPHRSAWAMVGRLAGEIRRGIIGGDTLPVFLSETLAEVNARRGYGE